MSGAQTVSSEYRKSCFDKSDIDRELAVFLYKFLRAIEGIDQEEISDIGNVACCQTLFSDDRDFGEKLRKSVEDEVFRG